jgi:low temperature requirement protein LtrA
VVAIAQLAHELVVDHSFGGFAQFAGLFLPVFIAWQGFSFYAERFDTDDVPFRAVMLVAMLAIAALAVQIPDVVHGDSAGFVVAYVALRSLMIGLYLRSYRHVPEARPLIARYAGAYTLGIAIWLVSLAFDSPERYVLWGVALAWEYSQPVINRRFHGEIPVDPRHVAERFALFTIIVFGESIVAVALGAADTDWEAAAAATAAFGFLTVAAMWWNYFGFRTDLGIRPAVRPILVFTQVHIPLLACLTAVSAGIALAIAQAPSEQLEAGTRWALCGGAALYLACLTAAQGATVLGVLRQKVAARSVAAAALVILAASGANLEPVLFSALTAAALLALATFETIVYARRA